MRKRSGRSHFLSYSLNSQQSMLRGGKSTQRPEGLTRYFKSNGRFYPFERKARGQHFKYRNRCRRQLHSGPHGGQGHSSQSFSRPDVPQSILCRWTHRRHEL